MYLCFKRVREVKESTNKYNGIQDTRKDTIKSVQSINKYNGIQDMRQDTTKFAHASEGT